MHTAICYQPNRASFFRLHDALFQLRSVTLRTSCWKKTFLNDKIHYAAITLQGAVVMGQSVDTSMVLNIQEVSLPFVHGERDRRK